MSESKSGQWQWENATAGAIAGFATVAAMHPLDVVRTRFIAVAVVGELILVNDGRVSNLPTYKSTAHAILTISRSEGLRGLYAGFSPAVLGSTLSWGLYFFFYGRAKQRYSKNGKEKLNPGHHLASSAEAGALVCLCTNPVWLVKTRLQLQTPLHQTRLYSGLYDALTTIMKEEGWSGLYKGIVPSLFLCMKFSHDCVSKFTFIGRYKVANVSGRLLVPVVKPPGVYQRFWNPAYMVGRVSHGAIQFTVYEELRKVIVDFKSKRRKQNPDRANNLLNSADYAILGGSSKIAAMLLTYPFQVIRARLQQRPSGNGIPRYVDSWHVIRETARFEGLRGFYRGITPNLLKNVPASSITFIVYENVLNFLKKARKTN
ncbi:Folate transporter 1 [Citrus sinensis]|uniref:Folate transporter 1 n=1 Tax=Citrus sinensis TaxID=2711 RepID=A0ACB8J0L3_CITSI|nr:Folate transporter 1 [Citrus sinensis]